MFKILIYHKITSKRSKDQIILKILETCQKSASKTGIVYGAGLNFHTVKTYLSLLTKKKLLVVVEGTPTIYRTTPKGSEAIVHIRALDGLIFAIGSEN